MCLCLESSVFTVRQSRSSLRHVWLIKSKQLFFNKRRVLRDYLEGNPQCKSPLPHINLCAHTSMKPIHWKHKRVHGHAHTYTQTSTNFFFFVCESFQSPCLESVHLCVCVSQQQVPIPFLSGCFCSDCAHPPSNREVNPPPTSSGMPRWPRVCQRETEKASEEEKERESMCFSTNLSLMCFISGFLTGCTLHTSNLWRPADQTQQSVDSEIHPEFKIHKCSLLMEGLNIPLLWYLSPSPVKTSYLFKVKAIKPYCYTVKHVSYIVLEWCITITELLKSGVLAIFLKIQLLK